MAQNHWSKGGVTAHIHEDGTLEIVGQFGNGLGQALARDLFDFLDAWYGNSVPVKVDEQSDEPTVIVGAAELKPADIEPEIVKILQQDAEDFGPVPEPPEPEKTPEIPVPTKRRPGRPRKGTTGGADGGA
jgi:hypothetical protein